MTLPFSMRRAQKSLLMTLWEEVETAVTEAEMGEETTAELQQGVEATAVEDQPGMVEEESVEVLWMRKWVRAVADQERAVVREALTWTPRYTI